MDQGVKQDRNATVLPLLDWVIVVMSAPACCFGALALEVSVPLPRSTLPRAEAAELADRMADDLARLLRGVDALDLAVAAAAFDPTELLRPRWPIHTALAELIQRAPRAMHSRILGFGSHEGAMPAQLEPDSALREGPLKLLPFVLSGDAGKVEAVSTQVEELLLEKGMAQAALAFFVQKAFNAPLEHVRFLSLDDLVAMTAMQYQHAGIEHLWPLIDAALFHPDTELWLDAPPEPLLRWDGHTVRMAEMDQATWQAHGFVPEGFEGERAARGFGYFQRRQQQYQAVLKSHAIDVQPISVPNGCDPRAALLA